MKYLIVFGRDPEISKAELEEFCKARNITLTLKEATKHLFSIETDKELHKEIDLLGGTIKMAEILFTCHEPEELDYLFSKVNLPIPHKEKVYYALDDYGSDLTELVEQSLKAHFKELRVKAMLKKDLSPKKFHKKKIADEGIEILLYKNTIARTVAVTNPLELKKRDERNPEKNYAQATSIRLAKILLNLAGAQEGHSLLDPFCKSGTILEEALLRNIQVYGRDDSIKEAQINIKAFIKEHHLTTTFSLKEGPLKGMDQYYKKEIFDCVVTEPHLGPERKKLPSLEEAREILQGLKEQYKTLFSLLQSLVKPRGTIVIILPELRTFQENLTLSLSNLIGQHFIKKREFNYGPPSNKVKRKIYVLQKQK